MFPMFRRKESTDGELTIDTGAGLLNLPSPSRPGQDLAPPARPTVWRPWPWPGGGRLAAHRGFWRAGLMLGGLGGRRGSVPCWPYPGRHDAMPETVALFNGCGGVSSLLVRPRAMQLPGGLNMGWVRSRCRLSVLGGGDSTCIGFAGGGGKLKEWIGTAALGRFVAQRHAIIS